VALPLAIVPILLSPTLWGFCTEFLASWSGGPPDRQTAKELAADAERVTVGGAKLWEIYEGKLLDIEKRSGFADFYDKQPVTKEELTAKPSVLLLGSFSTGKTSFIQWLTGKESRHFHIGPDPTTDFFMAVTYPLKGSTVTDRLMAGHSATADRRLPYKGLEKFSHSFLDSFRVLEMDAPILKAITFIDTPGIQAQAGTKKLGYSRTNVTEWFAERSDLIMVLFDPEKTTISEELNHLLQVLQPFKSKVRYVLNKADRRDMDFSRLVNVYGAILHKVGMLLRTEEKPRIAITSLKPWWRFESWRHKEMLDLHKSIIRQELRDLPKHSALATRREMLIHRARQVDAHCKLLKHLRESVPLSKAFTGSGLVWLANHLEEFLETSHNAGVVRENLPVFDLMLFRKHLIEMSGTSDLYRCTQADFGALLDIPDAVQQTSMDSEETSGVES